VGQARPLQYGTDVTVVAWGNTVAIAEEAVVKAGISADVLDLRWLIPWDREAIVHSLAKTGRLVIVQEDMATGSLGASILATLLSQPNQFYQLAATPRLLSRPDTPVPFSADLEYAILPSVESVARVLAEVASE
jgi:pyruvate/2-oxoglutarate/acetoin dehydrogenase E1 component